MTNANSSVPIAGWYPDPENDKDDRWWNGASWSEHRRSRGSVTAGPAAPAAPAAATAPAAAAASVAAPVTDGSNFARPNPYAASTAAAQPVATPYAQPGAPSYPQGYPPQTYPAQGYPAQPYAYAYPPRTPNQNVIGLVGMIISLVGFFLNLAFFAVPGIAGGIVSIFGLRKARGLKAQGLTTGHGYGISMTGLIVGFGGALVSILILILIFVSTQTYQY
jgi:hypothetical protein